MALQTQFISSITTNFRHSFSPTFTIRSEKLSESPSDSALPKPGVGFGPSNTSSNKGKQKQQKGKRERASSIIRRTPVEKPAFASEQPVEPSTNERAFVLAWLGFGSVILVEGIALAASGFLPEEWDKLFVKYLYPTFTPTVFLFFAGAVAYGVIKYLQNEKITEQK